MRQVELEENYHGADDKNLVMLGGNYDEDGYNADEGV